MNKSISTSGKVDLSGVVVEFSGRGKLIEGLISTFNAKNDESKPHISVKAVDELPKLNGRVVYSAKNNLYFTDNAIVMNLLDGIGVQVVTGGDCWDVYVTRTNMSVHKEVYNYLLGKEKRILNTFLSYNCFWLLLHLRMLEMNRSFVHAAVFGCSGEARMITGTGGCGKTSSLFYLLDERSATYMSEDFGVLSSSGDAYYCKKPLSIYKSDLEFGSKTLNQVKKFFTFKERVIWRLSGFLGINPQKKVSPDVLLQGLIAEKLPLKKVFYVVRTNLSGSIEEIGKTKLIERMVQASLREFKLLVEIQHSIASNKFDESPIISYEEHVQKLMDIYGAALDGAEGYLVRVPKNAAPHTLMNLIDKYATE